MIEKYGVLSPENGETTIVESKEEAVKLFWERMIRFFNPYFINVKVDEVSQLETYYNDKGELISPLAFKSAPIFNLEKVLSSEIQENQIL